LRSARPAQAPEQTAIAASAPTDAATQEDIDEPGQADDAHELLVDSLEPWLVALEPDLPVDPSDVAATLTRYALDAAVSASAGRATIRRLFEGTELLALGLSRDATGAGARGTDADLLHFEIEEGGDAIVMLPVFTNGVVLDDAMNRNPEWHETSVLQLNGRALLDVRDNDVAIVVNPWSETEFWLPARKRRRPR
jgi:hypothetical protein